VLDTIQFYIVLSGKPFWFTYTDGNRWIHNKPNLFLKKKTIELLSTRICDTYYGKLISLMWEIRNSHSFDNNQYHLGCYSLQSYRFFQRNTIPFYFIASGVGLSPLYCGHFWPILPAPDHRWGWLWSNWWNEDWQEKPKYSENILSLHSLLINIKVFRYSPFACLSL
jgi:hypothetical protein